jgi:hypothetical protein
LQVYGVEFAQDVCAAGGDRVWWRCGIRCLTRDLPRCVEWGDMGCITSEIEHLIRLAMPLYLSGLSIPLDGVDTLRKARTVYVQPTPVHDDEAVGWNDGHSRHVIPPVYQ